MVRVRTKELGSGGSGGAAPAGPRMIGNRKLFPTGHGNQARKILPEMMRFAWRSSCRFKVLRLEGEVPLHGSRRSSV